MHDASLVVGRPSRCAAGKPLISKRAEGGPVGRLLACEPEGPLGRHDPRGPSSFERTGMPRAERNKCSMPAMRPCDI